MKEITIDDVRNVYDEFVDYTFDAEQHEFGTLFMLDIMIKETLNRYEKAGVVDQKEARTMFRALYKYIGRDYSEYIELA